MDHTDLVQGTNKDRIHSGPVVAVSGQWTVASPVRVISVILNIFVKTSALGCGEKVLQTVLELSLGLISSSALTSRFPLVQEERAHL